MVTMLGAARALVIAATRRLKRLRELFDAWDARAEGVVTTRDMTAFMRAYEGLSEEEAADQADANSSPSRPNPNPNPCPDVNPIFKSISRP